MVIQWTETALSCKVVYEVVFKDDEVWILRVFHTAQNPQKLMDSFL